MCWNVVYKQPLVVQRILAAILMTPAIAKHYGNANNNDNNTNDNSEQKHKKNVQWNFNINNDDSNVVAKCLLTGYHYYCRNNNKLIFL